MAGPEVRIFDYDKIEIGEELGSYEYTLTHDMLDNFPRLHRRPRRRFPDIGGQARRHRLRIGLRGQHRRRQCGQTRWSFFNPPVPGKKIHVTGRIADKYMRRDKPYMVIEATAIDEDGRLLEKLRTYQMKKPDEVGKKWHPQA